MTINEMVNKKGGLLGLSGISNDMRDLHVAADSGNQDAQEALEVFAHRIRMYIGAYAANMVKVDALIFTGGIGENDTRMREMICHRLENIGIVMDYEKNKQNGSKAGIVSVDYSPISIVVIRITSYNVCYTKLLRNSAYRCRLGNRFYQQKNNHGYCRRQG